MFPINIACCLNGREDVNHKWFIFFSPFKFNRMNFVIIFSAAFSNIVTNNSISQRKLEMIKSATIIFIIFILINGCDRGENKGSKIETIEKNQMKTNPAFSGYAKVNGLKMYYEIHGQGSPLVLIHGGGSTIQTTFGRVLDAFAKNHKVVAVELQAHGHTGDIDRPLSFQQDADDIATLLSQLGINKADIFGFSNGASTTLELAIRHPGIVSKIIVASTFFKKDGAPSWFWDMMSHPTFDGMPKLLKEAYLRINPDRNALLTMYNRDVARMQSFPDIKEEDIKSITAQTLILIADRDVVKPEHAVEMYHLLPHAQLMILPGIHGEYIGEITTPQDQSLIHSTVSLIEKFLDAPMTK
jgi:pimeloyl-ACP methyl ester carboxylesterase